MPSATIRSLIERRVPQYLAVYLGSAFGLVEFVDFITTRYMLSPRWTDLTLLALVLLLPSVLLYTYHHGRPGRDEWQRSEKIFIPANLVLLVVALTLVGTGSNLDAVTTRVTVTDEKGNKIEAVVPNKAYRKRVAMFLFDSPNDASVHWLRYGMPWFIYQDLLQQQFIEVIQPAYLRERLERRGFAEGVDIPLTLKRDVASEMHIPHFVTGTVSAANGEVTATIQLYETATAKLVKERTVRGASATDLADQLSAQILKDFDIPVITDAKPDLPVAELLTRNPEALRAYVDGQFALQLRSDWQAGAQLVNRAVELDPTFAAAHLARYVAGMFTNRPEQAQAAIQSAMDHAYRLPERMQQLIKADYYVVRGDYTRAFAVLDMLKQLYPDDISIHELIVQISPARDDLDAMVASLEKIYELDPSRAEVLQQIGDTYQRKGDATRALKYYEDYAGRFPNEAKSFRKIGVLQRRIGEIEGARAAFRKAQLIDPQDVETLVDFAMLDRNTGAFGEAQQKLDEALSLAKTAQAKANVYDGRVALYETMGQIEKQVRAFEARIAELSKFSPPALVLVSKLRLPGMHAKVSASKAHHELAQLQKQLAKPFDLYLPIAEFDVHDEFEDVAGMQAALDTMQQLVEKQSQKFLQRTILYGRGRVHELRNNCAEAIRFYQQQAKLDPLSTTHELNLGRCYRKLGRTADAEKALKKVVRVVPANGEANLELALLYRANGDRARSAEHAQRAAMTWQSADANYKPARELKQLLAQ